jgi:hypothetical protein
MLQKSLQMRQFAVRKGHEGVKTRGHLYISCACGGAHLLTFQTVFFMPGLNGSSDGPSSTLPPSILSTVVQIVGSGFCASRFSSLCQSLPPGCGLSSIVPLPLSFCVRSRVVMPRRMANRSRRDPIVGVASEVEFECVLKPAMPLSSALRFRNMCHMMGRFVQRMPPRGSKTEYAPSGT